MKEDEIVIKNFHFQDVSEIFQAKNDIHVDERFKKLLTFEKEMGKLKAYPVPESLTDILRPYQKYGYYWLSSLNELGFSEILADDMGLGKTLQVIKKINAEHRLSLSGTPVENSPVNFRK
jgi:SNF2 family DNA or RNA helicase